MKKRFSKFFSVALATFMIVGLLPMQAFANDDNIENVDVVSCHSAPCELCEGECTQPCDEGCKLHNPQADPVPVKECEHEGCGETCEQIPCADCGLYPCECELEEEVVHTIYYFADEASASAALSGGGSDVKDEVVNKGAFNPTVTADVPQGKVFDGWYDAATGSKLVEGTVLDNVSAGVYFLYPTFVDAKADDDEDGAQGSFGAGASGIITGSGLNEVLPTVSFYVGDELHAKLTVNENHFVSQPEIPDSPEGLGSFKGWYEHPEFGNVPFNFENQISTDKNLYARFETTYLVRYLVAPGSGDISTLVFDSVRVTPGNTLPEPNYDGFTIPANKKFRFFYQNGAANPEEARVSLNATIVNGDMVLAPYFSDNYLVTFESLGDPVEPQLVSGGECIDQSKVNPRRDGYRFSHWIDSSGNTFDITSPINDDISLTSVWVPVNVSYKIVYWLEKPNVSGDPGTDTANYDFNKSVEKKALSGAVIDLTNGSGLDSISYAEFRHGESKTVNGSGTTVINVYFKRIVYTLNFDLSPNWTTVATMEFNGNTYRQNYSQTPGTAYSFQAKWEQDISNLFPTSANAIIRKTGIVSTFSSWSMKPKQGADIVSKILTLTSNFLPSSGTVITATANWGVVNEYTVNYYFERMPGETGGTNYNGTYYIKSEEYSQKYEGSYFLSAKEINGMDCVNPNNQSGSTKNFYYKRARYDLSFNSMGGTVVSSKSGVMYGEALSRYLPSPEPTRSGFSFEGWYYDNDYKHKVDFTSAKMPNNNLGLFAKWQSTQWTVNFSDTHGGVPVDTKTCANNDKLPGESIYELEQFVEGKGKFLGWFFIHSGTGMEMPFFYYETNISKNYNVYAKWQTKGFKVSYTAGRGTGNDFLDPHDYDLKTSTRLLECAFTTPENEQFVGWKIISGGGSLDGTVYFEGEIVPINVGNLVLEAQYAPTTSLVKVVLHANNSNATQQTLNRWVPKSSVYTLPGESFFQEDRTSIQVGWYAAAPNGTAYNFGDNYSINTGSVNFYAKWEQGLVSVKFVSEPAEYGDFGAVQTIFTGIIPGTQWSSAIGTTPTPKPAGNDYYFVGWKNDNVPPSNPSFVISDNLVYTAVFAKKTAISITTNNLSKAYDGIPLAPAQKGSDAYSVTGLPEGYKLEPVFAAYSKVTNVLEGPQNSHMTGVTIRDGQNNNVTNQFKISYNNTGKLSINPLEIVVQADSSTSGNVFDGASTFKVDTYSLPGNQMVGSDTLAGIKVNGSRLLPGNSPTTVDLSGLLVNGVAVTEGSNYKFTPVNGELVVDAPAAELKFTITGRNDSLQYNGAEQTQPEAVNGEPLYKNNLPENFSFEGLTVNPAKRTNVSDSREADIAGKTEQTLTVGGNGFKVEYTDPVTQEVTDVTSYFSYKFIPGSLTITPKSVNVTFTLDPSTVRQDATSAPVPTFSYNGLIGTEADALRTSASITSWGGYAVGTPEAKAYTVKAGGAEASFGNHSFSYVDGNLTVLAAGMLTYNPNGHSVTVPASKNYTLNENVTVNTGDIGADYAGWTFLGWATSAKGEVVYPKGTEQSFSFTQGDVENGKVLYAVWEADLSNLNATAAEYKTTYNGLESTNGTAHSIALSGVVSGDEISYIWKKGNGEFSSASDTNPAFIDAGEYTVKATVTRRDSNDEYSKTVESKVIIDKAVIEITPKDVNKVYDGAALVASEYTITSTGKLAERDSISLLAGAYTGSQTSAGTSSSAIDLSKVKITYTIDGVPNDSSGNYTVTSGSGELKVNPKALGEGNLSLSGTGKIYDGVSLLPVAATNTGLTVQYSTSLDNVSWSDYTTAVPKFIDAGTYYVKAKIEAPENEGVPTGNYSGVIETEALSLTISKKDLTISALVNGSTGSDNKWELTYLDETPSLSLAFSGFVNTTERQDDKNVISNLESPATTYVKGSGVGETYPVTLSYGEAKNYNISFAGGEISVRKYEVASLGIIAADKTTPYNGADQTLDAVFYSVNGLPTGFSLKEGVVSYDANQHSYKDVKVTGGEVDFYEIPLTISDTLTIVDTGGSDVSANFKINESSTSATARLKITPLNASLTANNATVDYGEAMPQFTYEQTGFIDGDGPLSEVNFELARENPDSLDAGVYNGEIVFKQIDEYINNNYIIKYVPGNLTISKAKINVSSLFVNDETKTYGFNDPEFSLGGLPEAFTADVAGAGSGDYQVSFSRDDESNENVGSYGVAVDSLTLYNANYELVGEISEITDGVLTIEQRELTLGFEEDTYFKNVGEVDAEPRVVVKEGETAGNDILSYTTQRDIGEEPGIYIYRIVLGSNPNYDITTETSQLIIIATGGGPPPTETAAPTPAPTVTPPPTTTTPPVITVLPTTPPLATPTETPTEAPTPEPSPTPVTIDPTQPPLATPAPSPSQGAEDIIDVNPSQPPLAEVNGGSTWALLNLLIAIATTISSVLLFVFIFAGNKKKNETEEERKIRMAAEVAAGGKAQEYVRNKKSGAGWRAFSIIAGLAAPIIFLITQSIGGNMLFTDKWTLLMVAILVVHGAGMLIMNKVRGKEEDSGKAKNI